MNDSQPSHFQRPVFSSRPNPQSDPKQSLNMTWFLVKQSYPFLTALVQWKGKSPL